MQGGALGVETVLSGFSRHKSLRGLHRPVRVSGFRDSDVHHFSSEYCLQSLQRVTILACCVNVICWRLNEQVRKFANAENLDKA